MPIERHIWLSFVISCFFVSVAGALYALLNNFIDPRALRFDLSGNFVIMAVMGGMRSFWGPLIGAAIFVALQDYVSSRTENWMSLIGLVFVLVVRFFPRGVLGRACAAGRGMSLLQVESVSKRFGSLIAVDDVSLTIEPGELRAIIGPNGAGKTTFFNLISGLFAPTSGAIRFEGEDITALSPEARVRRGMARTFQITEIFPELCGRRQSARRGRGRGRLRPAALARRAPRGARSTRASTELLAIGGLTDKRDQRVGALSHGDQRAAEIMMALALRPRLLLLDEPTAGMGDQETYDIARLIRRLHRQEGLTIMLIEHDMRVVFNLADRIMVLAEGARAGGGDAAGDRRQRDGAGAPISARPRHDRARGRGPAHLLRQEPHPARRLARSARGRDRRAARPQRRRQDHDAAQPDRPHAGRARARSRMFGAEVTGLAAVPHRRRAASATCRRGGASSPT